MPEPDRAAYEAAEKLVREATARAEEAAREAESHAPPNGWGSRDAQAAAANAFPDLGALLGLVEGLRGQLPPELARQVADALRELLIALRAVLDYTIDRLDQPPPDEREVEDIPIR
jgi:hypothetical protein